MQPSSDQTAHVMRGLATRMYAEAAEAPQVVARLMKENAELVADCGAQLRKTPPFLITTIARGSSGCAATYARYLIETRLKIPVAPSALSVHSLYRRPLRMRDTLALSISQSGKSGDLLAAAAAARTSGARHYAFLNDVDAPLASLADVVLPLRAGQEKSIAATKSFIASLAALLQLVAAWAEDGDLTAGAAQASEQLEKAQEISWPEAVEALMPLESVLIIARGYGLSIAQELALKLAETCGIRGISYSGAEFNHGPISLIQRGTTVIVLTQDDETRPGLAELVARLVERGARVLQTGLDTRNTIRLPTLDGNPVLEPLLQAQTAYHMLVTLAIARGRHPDAPSTLSKITTTI